MLQSTNKDKDKYTDKNENNDKDKSKDRIYILSQISRNKNKNTTPILIKNIACGDLFTVFLSTSGEVFVCGAGLYMGSERWMKGCSYHAERVDLLIGE